MADPTGHCPYLGLKQNRAIRFASPTPEHRCYISGEPLEIPVDQSSYCLSQGHIHCPLYMGLTVPTTSDTTAVLTSAAAVAPAAGLRGWYGTLSPRDRAIYAFMLAMLAIIVSIYLFVGLQSLFAPGGVADLQTPAPATAAPTGQPVVGAPTAAGIGAVAETATAVAPTPTDLPTNTPEPSPTAEPTAVPLILQPTDRPTLPPTSQPTSTSTATAQAATNTPAAPTTAPKATSRPPATSTPRPTSRPAAPTPVPATQPPPTPAPPPPGKSQAVTLYFADVTGTLMVPVRRNASVSGNNVAAAAVRELIAGPRNGLNRLVAADVNLLGATASRGAATVNFDRDPGGAGAYDSIVLTLTQIPGITRVQIQVGGRNVGGVRGRPVVNPINPDELPNDSRTTEFLPIYFPSIDGVHDVRLIRMVPKTRQTAEGTVRALLEGPGQYAGAVIEVIPPGTELRGIKIENGVVLVDFTQPFADAPDAAVRSIIQSLTTLPTVRGVQFLVEGQPYLDGRIFERPAINQE